MLHMTGMGQRGFTLIELLVVISIIGLLASVVLASISSARDKARVAQTVTDLKEIKKVIDLYFADHNAMPCVDHLWSDTIERNWSAPYYQWHTLPWGGQYHLEYGISTPASYSISMNSPGSSPAQSIDTMMDDGNLATGLIRGSGGRLEYYGIDPSYPYGGVCP